MHYSRLLTACALPLAACHSSGPSINEKNVTAQQVANSLQQATSEGLFFRPGKWISTITVDEMTIPGLSPQAQAMMKSAAMKATGFNSCLTPEQAKNPGAQFFSGKNNCRYDHFTMSGGKIDAKMVCTGDSENDTFQMSGKYSADAYHMTMVSNVGAGGQVMTMRTHVDSRRVGDCSGKES